MPTDGSDWFHVHYIEDNEVLEKTKAMVKLLTELHKGFRSGEEQGWLSEKNVRRHFAERRKEVRRL